MSLLILSFMGACALLELTCQFRSRLSAMKADGHERKSCYKTGASRSVGAETEGPPRNIKIFLCRKIPPKKADSTLVIVENGCYLYLFSGYFNFWPASGDPRGNAEGIGSYVYLRQKCHQWLVLLRELYRAWELLWCGSLPCWAPRGRSGP